MTVARAKAKAKELFNIGRVYYDRAKNISHKRNLLAVNENDRVYYDAIGAERIEKKWELYDKMTMDIEKALEKRGIRVVIGYWNPGSNYRIYPIDKWEKLNGRKFNRSKDRDRLIYEFYRTDADSVEII